jgi:hypothetical protein
LYLALSLAALGQREEAWAMALTGKKLNDGLPLGEGYFAYLAGVLGHETAARTAIKELQPRPALPVAWAYLGLGDTTAALDWLETAVVEREPYAAFVNVSPAFDAMRDHPRFKTIALSMWP